MTPLDYTKAVRRILEHLETTQLPAIEEAADLVIDALTNGGAVFCHEIGHGNQRDFHNRAGGLAALHLFTYAFTVTSPTAGCLADRPKDDASDTDLEAIRLAVKASNLRSGDVMLLSSVSGRNKGPVELALACRDAGIKTIGFTSLEYTSHVEAAHPSGKKLCDAVDVVIDIGAPYGDAAVEIPGYNFNLLPVSGVSMITAGWMIWGRVMEKMAEMGNPPTVFMSINRAGGKEHYDKAIADFNRRGY